MANLGFQFLYRFLNADPRFSAERFFLHLRDLVRGAPSRPPLSEESARPLSDFPVIAFTIPFENDYPAVPAALAASGIPTFQRDRAREDPLVIAGGVAVSLNPEPVAPFLDMVFIGEVRENETERLSDFFSLITEGFRAAGERSADRKGFLEQFAGVPSVYVPSAYHYDLDDQGRLAAIRPEPGFPATVTASKRPAGDAPVPVSVLFSPEAEFGESLLMEINRGCGRGCRFCAAGWIHRPPRFVELRRIRGEIDRALEKGRSVGLVGSDLARHPELEEILSYIVEQGGRFSLSSIRPEGLTDRVIRLLAAIGQKTATLAPETASDRMKKVIGKKIPRERFSELVERLVAAGIPNVRFYFMIGLPKETDEDAREIVEFIHQCREVFLEASRPMKRIGRIGVQINPFVPKPWTPFQWAPTASLKVLERRAAIIRKGLKKQANVVLRIESPKQALYQAVISRGDRRIAPLILRVAQGLGRPAAMREEGIDPEFYAYRERSADEVFPWDHIDHGISKESLYRVYAGIFKTSDAD
jgi:radical SAM superfamily enzyme YgiQ (UPF0313 family)